MVGQEDDDRLVKPKAYVVLKDPAQASPALADTLRAFVKDRIAPYKYPRWIEFVPDLPKTASGRQFQHFPTPELVAAAPAA